MPSGLIDISRDLCRYLDGPVAPDGLREFEAVDERAVFTLENRQLVADLIDAAVLG